MLSILVLTVLLLSPFPVVNSATPQARATGSNGAITVEWDTHPNAAYYEIRRTRPVSQILWDSPFIATRWMDITPTPNEPNSYRVVALDSSQNTIYEYPEVYATTNDSIPTYNKSCHRTLAFTINSTDYQVDGKKETMTAAPVIKGGRSFLVIRYVIEQLYGEIGWEQATKKITIEALGHTIYMWIGKPIAVVDGVEKQIDPNNAEIAPFILDGRTMVPLRFPVEALGTGSIVWHGDIKTAVLSFPMGCDEKMTGRVGATGDGFFELTNGSNTKRFEISGTAPFVQGSCASVAFEKIDGRVIVGRMVGVPCESPCQGEHIEGEVAGFEGNFIILTDSFGQTMKLELGVGTFKPQIGQCIAGCAADGVLSAARVVPCPLSIFEGVIEKTECGLNQILISSKNKSLRIQLPPDFPCESLTVGKCARIEGQADIDDSTLIRATSASIIPCGQTVELTLVASDYCSNQVVTAYDWDANPYSVTLPNDQTCSQIKPGTVFVAKGTATDGEIYASTVKVVEPPREPEIYRKAVVTKANPLEITIPASETLKISKPIYFGGELKVGQGVEVWGKISGGSINSVKLTVTPDYPGKASGKIVGVNCDKREIHFVEGTTKKIARLPSFASCDSFKIGTCISFLGESSEEEVFLVALFEEIECEGGCYGETIEAVVADIDCAEGTATLVLNGGSTINAKLPSDFDCNTIVVGDCVKACGHSDSGIFVIQTIIKSECPKPECEGEMKAGLVEMADCTTSSAKIRTTEGYESIKLPNTINCKSLAVGDCIEFCSIGSAMYVAKANCEILGDVLEGVVLDVAEGGYMVTSNGVDILLKTGSKLDTGACVKAVGAKEGSAFIATIAINVSCNSGSAVSGVITSIDCLEKKITIETNGDTEVFDFTTDIDCESFRRGDCILVQGDASTRTFTKIDCPDGMYDRIVMVVTENSNDWIVGTTLTTLSTAKVRGNYNAKPGDVISVVGERIDSLTFENATINPIPERQISQITTTLELVSWNSGTKTATLKDSYGSYYLAINPVNGFENMKEGDILGVTMNVVDPGYGTKNYIITETLKLQGQAFGQVKRVGVIFAIDIVDELILMHTYDGENVSILPVDTGVLDTIRIGDCAIATGFIDKESLWMKNATIEASDCVGGELGRNFTGVVAGIDAVSGRLQIASDKTDMLYTVWLEAVSQLSGLSLGDCVSCTGIVISTDDESNLLGRTVARIDCQAEGNKPIVVEGQVERVDEKSGFVEFTSSDGTLWKAYHSESVNLPALIEGEFVRCAGRLQAREGIISQAFISQIEPPTARWSVIGTVTSVDDGFFKLTDAQHREWTLVTNGEMPAIDARVITVGIVPPEGLATMDNVKWREIDGWSEPVDSKNGVVFGLSCGMDNLLIRDRLAQMTSIRLPRTGFCGYFTVGECVDMMLRVQASVPGMAKITSVSQSKESCFDRELVGRIVSRSTRDRIAVMITSDGRLVRLGFETEAATVKADIGKPYKVSGRFSPRAPDTLRVTQLSKVTELGSYESYGRVLSIVDGGVVIAEEAGRTVHVTLPQGTVTWAGLVGMRVHIKGQASLTPNVVANEIEVLECKKIAAELEGEVLRITNNFMIVQDRSGRVWRVDGDTSNAKKGDTVFVVGNIPLGDFNRMVDTMIIKLDEMQATTQILSWGKVESTDCANNIVHVKLDDSTVLEVHSGYAGQCETFTAGELVQINGMLHPVGGKRIVSGARMMRPGLIGDRKTITGVITEVSCTSRVIKVKEDDIDGYEGQVWTAQLADEVDCNELEVGMRVKVVGDANVSQKYLLEECDVDEIGSRIKKIVISGEAVTINCSESLIILKSEGRYYRVYPTDENMCEKLFIGNGLKVTGEISVSRKSIINNATWEVIPDTKPYLKIDGFVDTASCPDIRFYTNNEEYWTVFIAEGEPCKELYKGVKISLKGLRDHSQDHLMHDGLIYNYMQKQIRVGVIDDIDCSTGRLTVNSDGQILDVVLEQSFEECVSEKFSKGDNVQMIGYQHILYPASSVYFASLTHFGNSTGFIGVDFVGEVLITPTCRDGIIQVGTSHMTWKVRVPEGFDCSQLKAGDWVRVQGGRESWKEKIILATSIEKTRASLYGYVSQADYSVPVLYVNEMIRDKQWKVRFEDETKLRKFKKGDYVILEGDVSTPKDLINASAVKLNRIEGLLVDKDYVTQSITIDGTDFKRYRVHIKPEWLNLDDFKTNKGIVAVGIKGDKNEDGEIIMTNCWAEHDGNFDPKSVDGGMSLWQHVFNPGRYIAH
ncbi:MAG TPA: copper amine oxidase N-terminal domain-containing protein [Caldisericia bacterium]|nr:copper amine oxidase N-terminal domain-containing protein [Caldisericia bacterium]